MKTGQRLERHGLRSGTPSAPGAEQAWKDLCCSPISLQRGHGPETLPSLIPVLACERTSVVLGPQF